MNIKNNFAILLATAVCALLFNSCKVSYTLSGASIHPDARTVSIAYFPNSATLVAPILSSTLTDALQDKFSRQTRLSLVQEDGDLAFEGEITNYTSTPTAVTADDYASMNRLTITVRVRFTNKIEPEFNYERTFSQYQDFDSNLMLTSVEGTLIPEIVDELVEDIFNAAVSNW